MNKESFTSPWWLAVRDDAEQERSTDLNERLRLGRLAKLQTKARQACSDYLPIPNPGDPALNMLLVLYVAYAEQHTLSVTAVASSSGVPETTCLRWLDALRHHSLIRREPLVNDRRATVVHLTNDGVVSMEGLLRRQLQIFSGLNMT